MPKEVEDCVDSVLEDNPEYDESRAYAICHAQMDEKLDDVEDVDDLSTQEIVNRLDPDVVAEAFFDGGLEKKMVIEYLSSDEVNAHE